MPITVPLPVPADGTVSIRWVTALAAPAAPKLATEINAVSSVDITCLLTKEGFAPSAEPNAITDERLCSKQIFEDFGTVTYTLDELEYIIDPQNPTSASNKALATFVSGISGFLIARWGKDVDIAWAVGDKVDVYPVKMGPAVKQQPVTNATLKAKTKPFVTGPVVENVSVVA
jgi:hypothetical protein